MLNSENEIIIYDDGNVELSVKFEAENFWLRQDEIAKLFGKDRTVITRHINNILKDNEVDKKSNVQKMHFANSDKPVKIYSLDIILAVGYRTSSKKATQFRKWSTKILKEYLMKGHPFNDGNKRIGAYLFILFLSKNKALYKSNGELKINDNALASLALLVATSHPDQKDIIIKLIMNMLYDGESK